MHAGLTFGNTTTPSANLLFTSVLISDLHHTEWPDKFAHDTTRLLYHYRKLWCCRDTRLQEVQVLFDGTRSAKPSFGFGLINFIACSPNILINIPAEDMESKLHEIHNGIQNIWVLHPQCSPRYTSSMTRP